MTEREIQDQLNAVGNVEFMDISRVEGLEILKTFPDGFIVRLSGTNKVRIILVEDNQFYLARGDSLAQLVTTRKEEARQAEEAFKYYCELK